MTIGEKIRFIRKSLGLTQQVFADRIGVSQGTLNRYENDRVQPTAPIIQRIITEFRIPANLIITENITN